MNNHVAAANHPLKSNGAHLGKKIYVGADHNAKEIKDKILPILRQTNSSVIDISGDDVGTSRDYVDLAYLMADRIGYEHSVGILICGNGIGMSIVANRSANLVAARCETARDAVDSRVINNANVICLGSRHSVDAILDIVNLWMTTPYSGRKEYVLDKIIVNDMIKVEG